MPVKAADAVAFTGIDTDRAAYALPAAAPV